MGISHDQFFEHLAPHYDSLLDHLTFGGYANFLRRAIRVLAPKPGEAILDLCSGTGRAAHWIFQAVGSEGRVIGMDITPQMVSVARGRYGRSDPLIFLEKDVTQPWVFPDLFDGIFISFALHELPEAHRSSVFMRSFSSLKEMGRMVVADFNPAATGLPRILSLLFFSLFERRNLNFFRFDLHGALKGAGFGKIETFRTTAGILQITLARKG